MESPWFAATILDSLMQGIQERISAPNARRATRAKLRGVNPINFPAAVRPASQMAAFSLGGGLTRDGTIQERMRCPGRSGTEVMRTVAARVNLTPSHYAMLGLPRNFTDEQLRKQYRLLAMRYHPDAADRNGIDQNEALERFTALQTAYAILSDPALRRRYDEETRLQHRCEWRRACDVPTLLLVDKSGAPNVAEEQEVAEGAAPHFNSSDEGIGSTEARSMDSMDATAAKRIERDERARQWEAQRVEWLRQQLEAQHSSSPRGPLEVEGTASHGALPLAPRFSESEARRREHERARRRREQQKLQREREEVQRAAEVERALRQDEERAQVIEERVRAQVEARARRHGAESARREAAEAVRAVEERAHAAALAAEERALHLQLELDALHRQLAEAQTLAAVASASPLSSADTVEAGDTKVMLDAAVGFAGGSDDFMSTESDGSAVGAMTEVDAQEVELAVRRVEAAKLEEWSAQEWARRAVRASGIFPVVEPRSLHDAGRAVRSPEQALSVLDGRDGNDSSVAAQVRWVCIRTPPQAGKSVVMDTPFGRFSVLVPAGLPAGSPLLVPIPATDETIAKPLGAHDASLKLKEEARDEQLRALMQRGFAAQEAANYCDGTSTVEELAELIVSDNLALAEREPTAGDSACTSVGSSSVCLVS